MNVRGPVRGSPPIRGDASLDEPLGAPFEAEIRGRAHVAEKGRRRDDRRARQITEPADAHAVRPVPVERGDRGLALLEGVRPLPEAWPAPRLADDRSGVAEHARDRLAAEARI